MKNITILDKILGAAITVALIIGICYFFKKDAKDTTPEPKLTFEQLDEIQEIANDRTRNYSEILDDIDSKINEIKQEVNESASADEEYNREISEEYNDTRW